MTKLVSTFDDQYVISAGADGNLFVFKFNSQLEQPTPSAASITDKVSNMREESFIISNIRVSLLRLLSHRNMLYIATYASHFTVTKFYLRCLKCRIFAFVIVANCCFTYNMITQDCVDGKLPIMTTKFKTLTISMLQ